MPTRGHSLRLVALPVPSSHPVAAVLGRLSSPNSRVTYLHALQRAARLLSGGRNDPFSLPWPEVRYPHLVALRAAMLDLHLAPSTVNGTIVAVRDVLTECWRSGALPGDELQRIRDVPRIPDRRAPGAGRMLGIGELRQLIRSCRRDGARGTRDLAAIALLYGCGLRLAEAAALGTEAVRGGELRVMGKGHKEALLPISPRAGELLGRWLRLRGDGAGPLLTRIDRAGDLNLRAGISAAHLYRLMVDRCALAGLRPFTPHDLRRSFGSHLLDQGVHIREVQQLMRHASVTTTQRYDRRPLRDLARHAARLPF